MKSTETSADEPTDDSPSGPTRRTVLAAIGLTATAALAGCAVAGDVGRETTAEQYSVAGEEVGRIAVSGGDGETVVRGWDGTDVRIEATKYARGNTDLSDVRVTRDVTDGRLDVRAETTDGLNVGASGGGLERIEVEVPRRVRVARVGVADGTGYVADVAGDLELGVDDGTLELVVGGIESDATVRCDDGDITAQIASDVDATVVVNADDAPVRTEGDLFDSVETTEGTVRGQVGDGSGRLTLEVDDGAVQLRPL